MARKKLGHPAGRQKINFEKVRRNNRQNGESRNSFIVKVGGVGVEGMMT